MKEEYMQSLAKACSIFHSFKMDMVNRYFKAENNTLTERAYEYPQYCYTPAYRERFDIIERMIEISGMLGIKKLDKKANDLAKNVALLQDPKSVEQRKDFENLITEVIEIFSGVSNEIDNKISLLNPDELDRLNEAIHCFFEGCYHSAVTMSVSAIEFRLLSLMIHVNPETKLTGLTLGQLIREYLDKKERYDNVIPKKHEPLLNHCNVYRIFSVHPKKEEVNKPIANSILNMTFMFLLDESLVPKIISSEGKGRVKYALDYHLERAKDKTVKAMLESIFSYFSKKGFKLHSTKNYVNVQLNSLEVGWIQPRKTLAHITLYCDFYKPKDITRLSTLSKCDEHFEIVYDKEWATKDKGRVVSVIKLKQLDLTTFQKYHKEIEKAIESYVFYEEHYEELDKERKKISK